MANKQIAIRVQESTETKLEMPAALQKRSVNGIVNEAISSHLKAHPVSRGDAGHGPRRRAEDAALLKALAEA